MGEFGVVSPELDRLRRRSRVDIVSSFAPASRRCSWAFAFHESAGDRLRPKLVPGALDAPPSKLSDEPAACGRKRVFTWNMVQSDTVGTASATSADRNPTVCLWGVILVELGPDLRRFGCGHNPPIGGKAGRGSLDASEESTLAGAMDENKGPLTLSARRSA